jgi:hypothetical protein
MRDRDRLDWIVWGLMLLASARRFGCTRPSPERTWSPPDLHLSPFGGNRLSLRC